MLIEKADKLVSQQTRRETPNHCSMLSMLRICQETLRRENTIEYSDSRLILTSISFLNWVKRDILMLSAATLLSLRYQTLTTHRNGTSITRPRHSNQERLPHTLSKSLMPEETNWLESIAHMVTGTRQSLEMDTILETSMIEEYLMSVVVEMLKVTRFNGISRMDQQLKDGELYTA
jgi:hypothetical protein